MADSILSIAEKYLECGLSIIPIKLDGSKAPAVKWEIYQLKQATPEMLHSLFGKSARGIAIVCGAVSGNLEVIDIESWDVARAWAEEVQKRGGSELRARCVAVRAPRGGAHVYYRCDVIEGNQKLAQEWVEFTDEKTGEVKRKPSTLIETRGEGGYVIAPGSPAEAHPSGKLYEFFQLDFTKLPVITPEERAILLESARVLNRVEKKTEREVPAVTAPPSSSRLKPGSDFASRHTWAEILEPQGWTFMRAQGEEEFWQRPGKDGSGVSATINYRGSDLLKVFSSNAYPFEMNRTYTRFGAYTELNFNGDHSAAARALAKMGYGDPLPVNRYVEPDVHLLEQIDIAREVLDALGPEYNTELGNSDRLVRYFGEGLRFCKERGWLVWNGSRWIDDDLGTVRELIKRLPDKIREEATVAEVIAEFAESVVKPREELYKHAKKSATAKGVRSSLFLAETDPSFATPINNFDSNKYALNLRDKTVDLITGEHWDHKTTDLNTRQAATTYSELEDCPTWQRFLGDIQPDYEMRCYLQRAVGYSLTGDVSEQALFFCYGVGANGKSTFLDVILTLLGSYAMQTPIETFDAEKRPAISNDLARLVGARFVRVSETEEGQRLAESLIKQVTGGPLAQITTRFLNREYFQYTPQFKVWFDGNHKPIIKGVDKGIRRRLHLIPFNHVIPDAQQDKQLPVKLLKELPGILRWALDGAQWWHKLREETGSGLKPPAIVQDFTEEYFDSMDPLAGFFDEYCDKTGCEEITALYDAYRKHAENQGSGVLSLKRLSLNLQERGFTMRKHHLTRRVIVDGLSLKAKQEKTA